MGILFTIEKLKPWSHINLLGDMWTKVTQNNMDQIEDNQVEEVDNYSLLDYSDDEVECIKKNRKQFKHTADETEPEYFGWDGGSQEGYVERAVKRFRLTKLKSLDGQIYYFDNVLYFIWKYEGGSLVRPSTAIQIHLRQINQITQEKFLEQPEVFW